MNKSPLDPASLKVESFEATPALASFAGLGRGTACFETCKTDPTSDPDAETCGGNAGITP
jgi:hypothetical protein